jgi:glycine/D-amino acid oxidase-like deaminating enzyme
MTAIDPGFQLPPAERATLDSVCEALLPVLEAEDGDDPRLFGLDAGALGVAGEIERAVGGLGAAQRVDFGRLLRLLAQPAFMLLLAGQALPFAELAPARRERALLAMATSRLEPLRTGFQVLKRLAALLFYSLRQDGGENPSWPAIGYVPSTRPPVPPGERLEPLLRLTAVTAPATLEADVCVIGSGAGGCVAAAELAAAGRRVLVLEAGGGRQAADFDQSELDAMRTMFLDRGVAATRDLGIAILAGATLGGGTTVNWQTSLALPDAVRDEWAERSGCAFFAEDSFSRSLAAVSRRLGAEVPESVVNANNAVLRDGCRELGWRWQPVARNARGCDPRQCGYCVFGCRHGGKQTAATTFLVDAQREGDTRILARCRARRVLWSGGRACGVEAVAATAAGTEVSVEVRAPTVVVAAGSLHSPALLLRSGLGLAAVGRHLHLHPASGVAGAFASPIEPWSGPPQSILCDEFAAGGGAVAGGGGGGGGTAGGGAAGGYGFRLETAPAHPGLLALATPWCGARDHRREMQQSAHKCTLIVLVRDRSTGRVRVDRDGAPVVDYRPGRHERAQLRLGIAAASRVLLAAGARQLLALNHRRLGLRAVDDPAARASYFDAVARSRSERNWSTLFSAHQMGSCRMGADPRTAVCDAGGEVFGVRGLFIADASAFPASSGVNPMVTIMALAHHTAQHIKAHTSGA